MDLFTIYYLFTAIFMLGMVSMVLTEESGLSFWGWTWRVLLGCFFMLIAPVAVPFFLGAHFIELK